MKVGLYTVYIICILLRNIQITNTNQSSRTDIGNNLEFYFKPSETEDKSQNSPTDRLDFTNVLIPNRPLNQDVGVCPLPCGKTEVCNLKFAKCVCADGFEKTIDGICEDKDECLKPNACAPDRVCLNVFGSFVCKCRPGYTTTPANICLDRNECDEGTHTCGSKNICKNTPGSYRCKCKAGFIQSNITGCVKDPCFNSSCLNNCTCVPDASDGSYYCDNRYSSYQGENCATVRSMVECKPEKMTLTIPLSYIETFQPFVDDGKTGKYEIFVGPTISAISGCKLSKETVTWGDVFRLEFRPPFTKCDMKVTFQNDGLTPNGSVVSYSNVVWWSKIFPSLPEILIPYKMFDIKCSFKKNYYIGTIPKPKLVADKPLQIQNGSADVAMEFWRTLPSKNNLDLPLLPPAIYDINENIYVTVRLKSKSIYTGNPNVFLKSCAVSTNNIPRSEGISIIENGCKNPDTLFDKGVIENGNSKTAKFYFKMFKFQKKENEMFVSCQVKLCYSDCRPKNCVIDVRKRRDADKDKNIWITSNGPLTPNIANKNKNMTSNDNQQNSTTISLLMAMLIVSNIFMLAILGLVVYCIGRHIAKKKKLKYLAENRTGDPPPSISPLSLVRGTPQPNIFLPFRGKKKKNKKSRGILETSRTPYNSPFPSP